LGRLAQLLEQEIDIPRGGYDSSRTRELMGHLVENSTRPMLQLLRDIAEILFVTRLERSEYKGWQRGTAPPFRIRKILLEYAIKNVELDRIQDELTKGICARTCDRLPVGCCSVLGYDLGLVPTVMLQLQDLEARRAGWSRAAGIEEKCRYHTDGGCVLALFKSPACNGFMCVHIEEVLMGVAPPPLPRDFLEALATFRSCDIDRSDVFVAMDRAIETGRRLIDGR